MKKHSQRILLGFVCFIVVTWVFVLKALASPLAMVHGGADAHPVMTLKLARKRVASGQPTASVRRISSGHSGSGMHTPALGHLHPDVQRPVRQTHERKQARGPNGQPGDKLAEAAILDEETSHGHGDTHDHDTHGHDCDDVVVDIGYLSSSDAALSNIGAAEFDLAGGILVKPGRPQSGRVDYDTYAYVTRTWHIIRAPVYPCAHFALSTPASFPRGL